MAELTDTQKQTIETAAIDAYIAMVAWEEVNVPGSAVTFPTWEQMQPVDQEYWRMLAKTVMLSTQGPIYRHQVRDELVEVLGPAEAQISKGQPGMEHGRVLMEGDILTVYRAPGGKLWVRFPDEFSDGRFVPVVG